MRIIVIGGTVFVGRAIVEELVSAGHEVMVVHRGEHEPADLPPVEHLHVHRDELASKKDDLAAFRPDALLDANPAFARHADAVLDAMGDWRLLAISSMDTYKAYGSLHAGVTTEAMPIDEESAVRPERYPYRGLIEGMDDYDKLDVEERYVPRGGTICRLPIVYGPRDYQRREWPVLRRVAAGRQRMPMGRGSWLCTRGASERIAEGVRMALESDAAVGEIFNLGEWPVPPVWTWWHQVTDAATERTGHRLELVEVADPDVPEELQMSGAPHQHLMVSSQKATEILGWTHGDPAPHITSSVAWHLDNPPEQWPHEGFVADDAALAAADERARQEAEAAAAQPGEGTDEGDAV